MLSFSMKAVAGVASDGNIYTRNCWLNHLSGDRLFVADYRLLMSRSRCFYCLLKKQRHHSSLGLLILLRCLSLAVLQ